jgi:GAF domain-containing protein
VNQNLNRMPYYSDGGTSADRPGPGVEPSVTLSRADLSILIAAERRLAVALARPAEVMRFFLLAVEEAATLLRVDRAHLCLIDSEDPGLLRVVAGTGLMAEDEGELLPVEASFEGRVFQAQSAVRTNDLDGEPDLYRPRRYARRGGPAVAVPLRVRNQTIGVLLVARDVGHAPFLERDAELLLEFATPVGAAIEAMRQFDATRRSRESVDAWTRERGLRRWLERYEAVAAARVELIFRLDREGGMEWGGSTRPLFGREPEEFAPTVDDLVGRIAAEDGENVRRALHSLINPAGPRTISVSCGIVLAEGSIQQARLKAWRLQDGEEIVGVVLPATKPEVPAVEPVRVENGTEGIVRALRHQINNPLAAVMGRAQLMIREDVVQREPMLRQSVETILFESERINRFVQQLQEADGLSRLKEPLPGEFPDRGW